MKRPRISLVPITLLCLGLMISTLMNATLPASMNAENNISGQPMATDSRLLIRIGQRTFMASLLNNATVTAFKKQLPLTLDMTELNANEKYGALPVKLPTLSTNPGTIRPGDLMLYESTTLVLFYKSFSTSYNYTKLGQIDNPSGLAAALGTGDTTVRFELDKSN